jgi:hypothetical protein
MEGLCHGISAVCSPAKQLEVVEAAVWGLDGVTGLTDQPTPLIMVLAAPAGLFMLLQRLRALLG